MSRSRGEFGYGSLSSTEFDNHRSLVADPRGDILSCLMSFLMCRIVCAYSSGEEGGGKFGNSLNGGSKSSVYVISYHLQVIFGTQWAMMVDP